MTNKSGAEALVATLAQNGISHCFANPGTSEMHLVQALDKEPRIKSVLCLFEGVATAAADGFARIACRPAMTLLHLGPGYGNGIANIHNAMKANSAMINVVGDHATYHRHYDVPLTCDIETLVKPHSRYIGLVESAQMAGEIATKALNEAQTAPNAPVTIILPADSAWNQGGEDGIKAHITDESLVENETIDDIAAQIKDAKNPLILAGGRVLFDENGLETLSRLKALNIRIMMDTFPARLKRGGEIFAPEKMPYFAEIALQELENVDLMILAGTQEPVAFFAYPNRPSILVPEGCKTAILSGKFNDTIDALNQLANILNAPQAPKENRQLSNIGEKYNAFSIGQILAKYLPENSIICDDAVTAGQPIFNATQNAKSHDYLFLTGGAIGQGLPISIGAQMAAKGRKTFALLGDGASLYTIQSLWTMAREKLPIVTIIFANHSYRILNIEMTRTEAGDIGNEAKQMLSLDNPIMDFVKIAEGFGVKAMKTQNLQEFEKAIITAINANEPILIEAVIS